MVENAIEGFLEDKITFLYPSFRSFTFNQVSGDIGDHHTIGGTDFDEIRRISERASFDGTQLYVTNPRESDGDVEVDVFPVKYSVVQFLKNRGERPMTLSANGIFRTNDNYLILERRDGKLDRDPDQLHTYGGQSIPEDSTIKDNLVRRFGKDAFNGSLPFDVTLTPMSILRTGSGYMQVLSFAEIPHSRGELESMIQPGWKGNPEFYRDSEPSLRGLLVNGPEGLEDDPGIVLAGYAGLMKYGCDRFGDRFATDVMEAYATR